MAKATHSLNHPGTLVSVSDAATRASVDRKTIYRYIARGEILAYKVGRNIRVDLDSLIAWMRPINGGAE